jgi:hypothetical protein
VDCHHIHVQTALTTYDSFNNGIQLDTHAMLFELRLSFTHKRTSDNIKYEASLTHHSYKIYALQTSFYSAINHEQQDLSDLRHHLECHYKPKMPKSRRKKTKGVLL